MMPTPADFADALILTGPTGSGKSAVAVVLAELHGLEIVSMDSMTVYRQLNIGTAKPTPFERERVPHHLVDVLEPWQAGTVAWWLEQARQSCVAIRNRGARPLLVGGTPFYLKALQQGLFAAARVDPAIRQRLEQEAQQVGNAVMHDRLSRVDPISAARLHANDVRRVIRALEVFEATGLPISSSQTTWGTPNFNASQHSPVRHVAPVVVLDWPRDMLKERISQRVQAMLAAGWLDEVRQLKALPRPLSREASQALGYSELFRHLDGELTLAEAEELIVIRTRQFAKRQLTWFRQLTHAVRVAADANDLPTTIWQAWSRAAGEISSPATS